MTSNVEHGRNWADDDVPTEVLARHKGVHPIASLQDLDRMAHPELRDSDEDYEEFLTDLHTSRRSDMA